MNLSANFLYRHQKRFIWILIAFCIVLGLFIGGDYSSSADGPVSEHGGRVSLDYLKNTGDQNVSLWTDEMRYYGVTFELPLVFLADNVLHLSSDHEVYIFRNIITFLLFIVGIFFFYLFCLKRFKSVWLPLLGAVFLLVSPRIFADAFYNSKDIPTLVFFIISIFTLVLFLEKPTVKNALWHALACALLIDIRLPGIFVPLVTISLFILNFIFIPEDRKVWRKTLTLLATYILFLVVLIIVFWPFLWQHPVAHFLEAFSDMSHFSRQTDLQMLYAGNTVIASELPWHYIPLWILVTTPLVYVLLFFIGAGASIGHFFGNIREYIRTRRQDFVVLSWFFGPLIAIIMLRSIVYDGWRQLYFIYPAMVYLSLLGIEALFNFLKEFDLKIQILGKLIIAFIIAANLFFVLSFMVRNHPYQNLYFNALMGGQENARKNFEMDYWGLTFREGLEYIVAHDNTPLIPVYIAGGSLNNAFILTPEVMDRFSVLKDIKNVNVAKYVLSNYRWQEYDALPWDKEFYSVKVDGVNVMTVFKMY